MCVYICVYIYLVEEGRKMEERRKEGRKEGRDREEKGRKYMKGKRLLERS